MTSCSSVAEMVEHNLLSLLKVGKLSSTVGWTDQLHPHHFEGVYRAISVAANCTDMLSLKVAKAAVFKSC